MRTTTTYLIQLVAFGLLGFMESPATAQCFVAPSGLVSWWKLETNAADVFNLNNGTLNGSPTFSTGEVGSAMSFDGSDDYVSVAASSSLDVGLDCGLTIELWINPTSVSSQRPLVEWNNGQGGIGAHFWIAVAVLGGGSGSVFANLVDTNGTSHQISTATGVLSANSFQHTALTYDAISGLARIYVNGSVSASTNLGTFVAYTSPNLYFGKRVSGTAAGTLFSGKMDEISIFNRALTQCEIQAIYNAGSSGKCSP